MKILELRQHFQLTLNDLYPKEEIDSFFYILIEHFFNLKRIDYSLKPQTEIDPAKFNNVIELLLKETPIQYITGETEFYGLKFKVNKDVLIPRQETEELVDWIISDVTSRNSEKPLSILDIGTGSGCIPISLAKNIPRAKVSSIDISEKALEVAKINAQVNEINISFIQQDILTSTTLDQHFDVIVSNPPYVRELEKEEIKKNVLDYEPHLALFVKDTNPLLFYNKIADLALENLSPNGLLFFEINQYLGNETVDLLKQKGFSKVELRKDLFGNNRMIKAEK